MWPNWFCRYATNDLLIAKKKKPCWMIEVTTGYNFEARNTRGNSDKAW